MLHTLAIANYRSLRDLIMPLAQLNVISGANGSGKSSLYRALRLTAEAAEGRLIAHLAQEGGFASTLWAGPEKISPAMRRGEVPIQGTIRQTTVALKLGFAGDDFSYAIDLGLPVPSLSLFCADPEIKREQIWAGQLQRDATLLLDRRGAVARTRDGRAWQVLNQHVPTYDSVFMQCADPINAPEVLQLREAMRRWRFYDHLRTDAGAPARQSQIGTYTPILANDGANLAAALQTIIEIGEPETLAAAIDDAFPGARIQIEVQQGRFSVVMWQHGLLRPLSASEFSDGTLRYLLLVAALLSPRPPELLVLNEPETSLHPDLLPALARLIAAAATRSQVIVVSHASRLVAALEREVDCNSIILQKDCGETLIAGQHRLDKPAWSWLSR
ncbi:AAA family ATPase [Deefgea sp. CFH1-16]|uniref:AAA family ATPase n=1 Tax=Deefgea sp. CFH1-16 TaxID=2675457 RepID=UPI0015F4912A|nr:AAA family ATPase [Deefgea sp. CFH1-16]MBM5573805.1 AAA family ATPase [Deefgea sp. CFH1-16]